MAKAVKKQVEETGEEGKSPAIEEKKQSKKVENPSFEEWYCQIKDGKAEKLKLIRKRVLISEEQANILNEGRINGGNNHANLYFRPE